MCSGDAFISSATFGTRGKTILYYKAWLKKKDQTEVNTKYDEFFNGIHKQT